MRKIDLTGKCFFRLTAVRENGRDKRGRVLWLCKCSCGSEVTVLGDNLRSGRSTSCGCYKRERTSERATTHGLCVSYPRLYRAIRDHFRFIKNATRCCEDWQIDSRYTLASTGAIKFCEDLIALRPDECERYERDKSLEIDKDNDRDHIFRPESIVFVSHVGNISNRKCTLRMIDGTAFADFCRSLGVETHSHKHVTKQYAKYYSWFKKHNGEGHPELLKKANQVISSLSKCLKMLELLKDVRAFRAKNAL